VSYRAEIIGYFGMKKKKIFSLTCQGAFLNSRGVVDTELTGSFEKD